MKKITISSPAKINLTLDVATKPLESPFHPLRTIYHRISLADEIEITEAPHFDIRGDFDCPMEQNLIFKAFTLLQGHYQGSLPTVTVKVDKHIPAQAGLGGGSSNFGAFIRGYMALFELGSLPDEIVTKSGTIGKDIPFFLSGLSCALGTGFGEVIEKVPFDADLFKGKRLYLYRSDFGQSTAVAYANLEVKDTTFTKTFCEAPELERCGNSFTSLLQTQRYRDWLGDNIDKVHMAGSGSCVFSLEPLDIMEGERWDLHL